MYMPKHFQLYELVDKTTFYKHGVGAWKFLNPEALRMVDDVRDFFNVPIICNNWWGNNNHNALQYRGYRPPECTVGAPYSEHRKGNAFDLTVKGVTAEEARQRIMDDRDNPLLERVMRIEAKVNWLHIDHGLLKVGQPRPYIFNA